ncbi:hypothetical protein CAEBREN_01513 [Caenorhabditis brenneri]|uniref:Uncharacterized protein n=1 Tax=Caenorhabditis brenneri TaxID=135651 RepID=G0NNV4_CAEBE|nr:hypothetical protein CAEBREN_01513 [Caenorhabditis brenneri]
MFITKKQRAAEENSRFSSIISENVISVFNNGDSVSPKFASFRNRQFGAFNPSQNSISVKIGRTSKRRERLVSSNFSNGKVGTISLFIIVRMRKIDSRIENEKEITLPFQKLPFLVMQNVLQIMGFLDLKVFHVNIGAVDRVPSDYTKQLGNKNALVLTTYWDDPKIRFNVLYNAVFEVFQATFDVFMLDLDDVQVENYQELFDWIEDHLPPLLAFRIKGRCKGLNAIDEDEIKPPYSLKQWSFVLANGVKCTVTYAEYDNDLSDNLSFGFDILIGY